MNLFANPTVAAFMLQSNDHIARLIEKGESLAPDPSSYTGHGFFMDIIGIFAQFFLVSAQFLGTVFEQIGAPGAYGIAIILTAVVVRIMLLPLTRMQIRGMKSMQMLQPVMKAIQFYYPDKQNQGSKTMQLYSEYKINPLSGCFPMLIQMPILFGVYRALYDPFFAGKEFLGIQLLFPVNVTGGASFGGGPALADIIDVTVATNSMQHLLWHIPDGIPLIGGGFFYLPALILVVFYVGSNMLMQRVMRKVNAPDEDFAAEFEEFKAKSKKPNEPDLAAQMQKQMGLMNIMIIVFAFIFSAGALLYFICQNLLMTLEYTLLPKHLNLPKMDPDQIKKFIKEPPPPPGAAQQKLLDQQKQQQEGQEKAKKAKGGKVDSDAAEAADNNEENQEAGLNGAGDSEAVAAKKIRKPRKKRRKR